MTKPTLPNDPMPQSAATPSRKPGNFQTFVRNTGFLKNVLNPHMPEPNTGTHVPVWLSPKLAQSVLAAHGHTGHAILQPPGLNLDKLDQ